MVYGIKFSDSEEVVNSYTEQAKEEMSVADEFNVYFSNIVTANRVVDFCNQIDNKHLNYSAYALSREQEAKISKERIVDTYEQFSVMYAENIGKSIMETAERIKHNVIFANFKTKFDSMSQKEQFDYLDQMGLKYEVADKSEETKTSQSNEEKVQ